MDGIDRCAGAASVMAHLVVAGWLWWPSPGPPRAAADPPSELPASVITVPSAPAPARIVLVAAPEAAPLPALPPLPPLPSQSSSPTRSAADDLPSTVGRPIAPRDTAHPESERSRGDRPTAPAGDARLPIVPLEPAIPAMPAPRRWSDKEVTLAQNRLLTAATFIEGQLRRQFAGPWRRDRRLVADRRVIIDVMVDGRGQVTAARLRGSTGSAAIDQRIEAHVRTFGLPAIAADVAHPFVVILFERASVPDHRP